MHPRICHIGGVEIDASRQDLLDRLAGLGFDTVMACASGFYDGADERPWRHLAETCQSHTLSLLAHLDISDLDLGHPLVEKHPECFFVRYEAHRDILDPREPDVGHGRARLRAACEMEPIRDWWNAVASKLMDAGVSGICARKPSPADARIWHSLIARARALTNRALLFVADTPGTSWADWRSLSSCGFDHTLSSLPWWDGRANWLPEEHETLSRLAPPIAQIDSPEKLPPVSLTARRARLAVAAVTGSGVMIPASFLQSAAIDCDENFERSIRTLNEVIMARNSGCRRLFKPTGAGANLTLLISVDRDDERLANEAYVCVLNPHSTLAAEPGPEIKAALGDFNSLEPVEGLSANGPRFAPGEARLFRATKAPAIRHASSPIEHDIAAAVKQSRLVISHISPVIEHGKYPVKRIVGERTDVEADIFSDSHPVIKAELVWRADDEANWRRTMMHLRNDDRWSASMELSRIGRYRFAIEAWLDRYTTFARDLTAKRDAGQDVALETKEGAALVREASLRKNGTIGAALQEFLDAFERLALPDRISVLLAPETLEVMLRLSERTFLTRSDEYVIEAERKAARFASWYELFPRSQTDSPARHGTFRSTIARLPAIREMGFDVLYLTPIHPIGLVARKGRNNALLAGSGDPGSPYAIGSSEGGHDAIHPQLGTLEDFRALVTAAAGHGMEIALDFAVQCSRDHPWLKEHPGWFAWRADGSIRFAENPPKKYEDIVNIDFHAPDATPAAWIALRDVVRHWIDAGVRIFRVDNPHTKPFAFWEWLIADIRATHPNTIFLAEAFTRPKVMYHLAKLGFSQSYTYFTWRNTKRELTEYLTELSTPPVSDFFRPHFFVNTPDINPVFLQTSGRPGFLIRAALAATLSGLWGIYSGFELCEADALPGREEYLDSEKYEIKPRNWSAPGNIIAEISQLNRLRKSEPALQTHAGLSFYNAFNDHIIYYGKSAPGHRDRILIAVNLDPHRGQETDFEIPLWEFGLHDHESLEVEDLVRGQRFVWHGKIQHMRLAQEQPYAIWRVRPAHER